MYPMIRFACLLFLFFFVNTTFAAPIYARQNATPTTVMTVHSTMTPSGPKTETCVITLTPIKNDKGEDAVESVKRCKLTPDTSNNGSTGGANGGTTTFSTVPQGSATPAPSPSSSANAGNGPIVVIGLTTASSGSSQATPAPSAPSSISSSSSRSSSSTGSTSQSSSSSSSAPPSSSPSATISNGGVADGPASSVATGSVPTPAGENDASSSASVSAAAAEASNSATGAFSTPGQKISVLPIGLGVFAGISVIALIVVGLVTYERTKYRKAFRQRKLAESGAAMGYGGMAPRS